jgi:ribosome maturation protein SDO1
VSDKERRAELDVLVKDIVSVLVDKTINPTTSRPYTHTMLERALRDLHFNPDTRKSAKQQALEVGALCIMLCSLL